jgi:molecular chaperone GrpE
MGVFDNRPDGAPRPGDESSAPHDTGVRVVDRRWWARAEAGESDDNDGGASASDKPTYVRELEQRLQAKDDELRETIARYREASTEFEEMRARVRRDAAKDAERSRRQVLADLLEVVDNLDRAIDVARASSAAMGIVQGIELVRTQFLGKLEAHGVQRLISLNQPFDPQCHEATTMVPVADPTQDGMVVGVIHEGYAIGADVLRPAMVAVGCVSNEGAGT